MLGQVDGEDEGDDDRVDAGRAAVPQCPCQHLRPPRGLPRRPRIALMVAHDIVRPMPVPAPSPDARAVVTGASQNIGEALAIELAARGHHLIITARREEVLTALADRLTEQYGVTVEVRPVDLADPAERGKLADELAGRNISILCANAGTATFGPVATLDPADEKAQVQLNVLGVHDLVLAVLPGMVERRAGGILISGSAAGNSPIPNNATYAATKAFVNTFSESLRGELKRAGVHVTVLAPGPVRETLPDARRAVARREADPGLPVDLDRVHREDVAGRRWSATRCAWCPA